MRVHAIAVSILALGLLVGSLYYASAATGAQPQEIFIAQTQTATTVYCVYQQVFLVTELHIAVEQAEPGTSVQFELEVHYADGSPVTLNPERGSFVVVGAGYSRTYEGIPLTPTGTPGEYRGSITLPSDIPPGIYKLYCIHCTLSDGKGNFAPNLDVSSSETQDPVDSSLIAIQTTIPVTTMVTTATVQPPGFLSPSLLVGVGILVLIIAIIAALILRRPRKKTG